MKIKHTSKRRNMVKIALIIVLIIGLASAYIVYTYKQKGAFSSNSAATQESPILSDEVKHQADTPSTTQSSSKEPVQTTNNVNDTAAPPNNVTVTITALGQSGSTLQVRALINELWSDGQCTLTLSRPGSASITKYAKTQPLSSQSTCAGFDIDTTQLDRGTWSAKVAVAKDNQSAFTSKDIEIK